MSAIAALAELAGGHVAGEENRRARESNAGDKYHILRLQGFVAEPHRPGIRIHVHEQTHT